MDVRELSVVAGSFVGFQLLFSMGSPRLCAALAPGYSRLPPDKHAEWNSRLVSTIHALIVGLFCLYILRFDDAVNKDPVWGDPQLVKLNVAITCGYLLYDLLLLACNWRAMGDGFFVCHHLAALYAYGYVLVRLGVAPSTLARLKTQMAHMPYCATDSRGVLPYFANFRLISELSTPFVNQRWFFEVLSVPRTDRLVVANGIMMTVVFFLVRIAVIPSYYSRVVATFGTPAFVRLGLGPQVAWIVSSVCLDVLNTIWMYKIARGCYKVLTGRSRSSKGANLDKQNHHNDSYLNNHID
ncbi:transmembrane protein 56-B-like isoform X1 [Scleropages formosus]|uniref:transmembrane protein 56-B-like isoform X1 n=1 Tax=Scleropages formosus TaxID=113540 RepID=UPI0008788380|nr:transmembrane protein 56-B-like isoform X1 [Scleropages formosus]